MALLSFIERKTIYRLFGIEDGYVFKYWTDQGKYNKNDTHDIILESCGIDIYKDNEYSSLSQQKCIEKILGSDNSQLISALLKGLCDFFSYQMGSFGWGDEDIDDYKIVQGIIERLLSFEPVNLPEIQNFGSIDMLAEDIERNINNGTPELSLDRLHTYTAIYLQEICEKHHLPIKDDKGDTYPIHSLAGMLKNHYIENSYCKSEFSTQAVKTMISLFAKFNDIRNDNSFAHPNDILDKAEAEYVVKTMLSTLQFIAKIEEANDYPF